MIADERFTTKDMVRLVLQGLISLILIKHVKYIKNNLVSMFCILIKNNFNLLMYFYTAKLNTKKMKLHI